MDYENIASSFFRKVPATMEEETDIALVKEQSYNSASATAFYREVV